MSQVKDVKESKEFCDQVYGELIGIKEKLVGLRDLSGKEGREKPVVAMFERHLAELVEAIDWKIQILAHSCPYDWKGSAGYENVAQIGEADKATDSDRFSPGYMGG